MQFKTQWNYIPNSPKNRETPRGVSQTIPDLSLTPKQIIARFATGAPLSNAKIPIYDADTAVQGMPDLKKLDFAEIEDLKRSAMQNITDKRRKLKEQEDEKKLNKAETVVQDPILKPTENPPFKS